MDSKTMIAAVLSVSVSMSARCATFPLEWNATYRTDVPYEVELNPAKLGAKAFAVKADGKRLQVSQFAGKLSGTVALRFKVPAGTKSLMCETLADESACCASSATDNLFAGALDAANIGKWTLGDGIKAESIPGGIRFRGTNTKPGGRFACYTIDLPEGYAGKPVIQEMTLKSLSKLTWGGTAQVRQLDADGTPLPETLADRRWTTHMRPPQKLASYRDEGHVHPKAKKLRVEFELRTLGSKYDDYGLVIKDSSVCLPVLEVTRLAVREAELLPFPKWDDSFFTEGVSGKPGDTAMRFGGDNEKTMFYQLTSRGSWTESVQFREETDRYFPAGAGTVEAWFKPDWAAVEARRKAKGYVTRPIVLFEAFQGYRAAQCLQGVGPMFQLRYRPVEKTLTLFMRDWNGHKYEKSWEKEKFDIPEGVWTHIAVQWLPKGEAQVFLNGRKSATLPIPEYEEIPIGDKTIKNVNDLWAMEFFLGSSCNSARLRESVLSHWPLFEGAADNLRVSTGCRYNGDFTPAKEFKVDADTRALFTFDRAFDGVSGGGFGFIPASIRALTDRVDHKLSLDGKQLQYYPADIVPENDPSKVFNILNYPVMPKPSEYLAAHRTLTKSKTLTAGEKMAFTCQGTVYPEWVEFVNPSQTDRLLYPILVNKGRLDPRSFGDLSDSISIGGASDREKANRVFQYALSAADYFANYQTIFAAGSDAPNSVCYNSMIVLNSYCGFECGPLNNLTAHMFSTVAMCPASWTGGYGHSFEEVFFDGKNHIYDLSAQKFFPAMDNETSAYLKEDGDQPGIHNRIGGSADHFIRKSTRGSGAGTPSYQEKVAMVLNPGERFRVWYSNNGHMNNLQTKGKSGVYGLKQLSPSQYNFAAVAGADDKSMWTMRWDRFFPHYSTGSITFDGKPSDKSPALEQVKDDSFCYHVRCCYPIAWGEYAAFGYDGRAMELELSTDFGKTFHVLPRSADGVSRLEYRVKARHDYLVRVKAPLASVKRLAMRTDCVINPRTYPGWVKSGENELTFKAEPGGKANVTVAWNEPAKDIVIEQGVYSGTIPGCEKQLVLVDPAKPLSLGVKGVTASAKVKCFGKINATLVEGRLTLSYDSSKPLAMRRGDDLEAWYASGDPAAPARHEFPTVAGVEIVDGDAVKRLTVIVASGARFLRAEESELKGGAELKPADGDSVQPRIWFSSGKSVATFRYPTLPAGEYEAYVLARFASHPDDKGISLGIVNPDKAAKGNDRFLSVGRYTNSAVDFLKAHYAHKGERARWKWDTISRKRGWTKIDLPETEHIDVKISGDSKEGVELAALLLLPNVDFECLGDLRKVLFSLNCDPFGVR